MKTLGEPRARTKSSATGRRGTNAALTAAFDRLLLEASGEIAREAAADASFCCPFCDRTGVAIIACCGMVETKPPEMVGPRESRRRQEKSRRTV
jgi:hypothetical protein